MIKIKKKTFSGTSKVFDGELADAIRGIAQYQAAVKLDTAAVTALTNSAGGSANGTINPIGNVTPAVLGTTDCAQKAGFETALGTVKDAISEIVAKLNAIRAVVPAFPALTDSTGGAAADGTVPAITVSLTGVDTSLASAVGSQAVIDALKDKIVQARYFTNLAAEAVGVTPLVDRSGHVGPVGTTFTVISTNTGTAVREDDEAALSDFFEHVTPEDLHFRFLGGIREVSHDRLVSMTHVDHRQTENFIAVAEGGKSIIATAMLACDVSLDTGEVAISVRAEYQHMGVSWELLQHVARYAEARGIKTLQSIESRQNDEPSRFNRSKASPRKAIPTMQHCYSSERNCDAPERTSVRAFD